MSRKNRDHQRRMSRLKARKHRVLRAKYFQRKHEQTNNGFYPIICAVCNQWVNSLLVCSYGICYKHKHNHPECKTLLIGTTNIGDVYAHCKDCNQIITRIDKKRYVSCPNCKVLWSLREEGNRIINMFDWH